MWFVFPHCLPTSLHLSVGLNPFTSPQIAFLTPFLRRVLKLRGDSALPVGAGVCGPTMTSSTSSFCCLFSPSWTVCIRLISGAFPLTPPPLPPTHLQNHVLSSSSLLSLSLEDGLRDAFGKTGILYIIHPDHLGNSYLTVKPRWPACPGSREYL